VKAKSKSRGIPVRHFINKANAERYATDPDLRASLIVVKYHDRWRRGVDHGRQGAA
jgi:hypothetical protein